MYADKEMNVWTTNIARPEIKLLATYPAYPLQNIGPLF